MTGVVSVASTEVVLGVTVVTGLEDVTGVSDVLCICLVVGITVSFASIVVG